jgi:hypothetical protein
MRRNYARSSLPMAGTIISACDLVQFAVGEAHSPITPNKLDPTLRYKNEFGKTVRTPLSKVLSFSEEMQARR